MRKLYIYKNDDGTATIYYNKDFPESNGIPVFEYEGVIPDGPGLLKTDGAILYREEETLPEPEVTTDDVLNALLGVIG